MTDRARLEIAKEFTFEAAHWLPNVPEGHKCGRIHGHSYRVEVAVVGYVHPAALPYWVVDFGELKEAWKPLDAQLDHNCLNYVPGLEDPTAETLAVWIWKQLEASFRNGVQLEAVTVHETCTSRTTFKGVWS